MSVTSGNQDLGKVLRGARSIADIKELEYGTAMGSLKEEVQTLEINSLDAKDLSDLKMIFDLRTKDEKQ